MAARNLVSMAIAASIAMLAGAVYAAPANRPYASDAHRGLGGAYGTMKRIPQPRDLAPKRGERREPYPYRYYSDTDRSPSSCRRYAQRAIATRNANWWTRYRACLN
ncbi:MAG TPA: hypothetical protein VFF87_01495 [Hyphomicrobium sp.]|nr:hypothetical protein [Hyphomicrobium sp.]